MTITRYGETWDGFDTRSNGDYVLYDTHVEIVNELVATLEELADVVDSIRTNEYTPDSFTTQPARFAILRAKETK